MISYKDDKLSLEECKKTLNVDGDNFTDEQIILIRDWLYHMADIAIMDYDQRQEEKERLNKTAKIKS